MKQILASLLALTGLASCGLIGFSANLDNGVRNHHKELVGFDISDVQSTEDQVQIKVKNKYRAKVTADSASNTSQEDVSASNKVDVRIAVDKILATYLSAGGSTVASAVKLAAFKRDNGMASAKEVFAANLAEAKTTKEVEAALNEHLAKNEGDALTVNLKKALEAAR